MGNLISSFNVYKYAQKFDTLGVGCDYLRLSYFNSSEFIESRLDLLDTDNSNFGTIEINNIVLTYQKIPTTLGMGLIFSCSYNEVSVPIFEFVKFNENTNFITNRYGKLDFYGSFFRLGDLGFYELDLMLSMICFYISEENPNVTRYDYRIDYFNRNLYVSIEHWKKVLDIKSQTKIDPKYTGDELTNWLVGKKDTGTYCIRLYNKLLDTDFKDKIFLYQDYFNYKTVQRLEFELQRNFLKGFTLEDYLSGLIQQKIESILGINENLRNSAICYQYDSTNEITDKNRSKYIRRFNNVCIKFAKNKINPFITCYESLHESLEESALEDLMHDFLEFYVKAGKKNLVKKFKV